MLKPWESYQNTSGHKIGSLTKEVQSDTPDMIDDFRSAKATSEFTGCQIVFERILSILKEIVSYEQYIRIYSEYHFLLCISLELSEYDCDEHTSEKAFLSSVRLQIYEKHFSS